MLFTKHAGLSGKQLFCMDAVWYRHFIKFQQCVWFTLAENILTLLPIPSEDHVKYCFAGKSVLGIFFSLRDYCCVCSPDLSIFSMRSCGPVNSLRVGTCVPVVATDELLKICSRIGGNEAPDSIDISDNTHKTHDRRSNMFAELCKTGQLLGKPFSYRPIPSLDAVTRI